MPAPSLGALCGLVLFPNSAAGVWLYGASKLWLLALPVVWLHYVERAPFSLSPARRGGFVAGVLSGLAIAGVIVAGYLILGDSLIDRSFLRDRLTAVGLGVPSRYVGAAAYWILVNSVLEEYVWRWFCVRQCEQVFSRAMAAVCSALFFTIHHVVAMQVYLGPAPVAICALGVFSGGAIWSLMYIRYRSIWPGYVSHALVDVCVFGIGASILFGAR